MTGGEDGAFRTGLFSPLTLIYFDIFLSDFYHLPFDFFEKESEGIRYQMGVGIFFLSSTRTELLHFFD